MKRLNDMLGVQIALILNGRLPVSMKREEGQGLVEYALIMVMVAIIVIVILAVIGPSVGNVFSQVITLI